MDMSKEEKQEIIKKYAKKDWKNDFENIVVNTANNAEEISKLLENLNNLGYPSEKVIVVFPEKYSLEDLETNEPEPEGTIWYVLYYKERSKNRNNLDDDFAETNS